MREITRTGPTGIPSYGFSEASAAFLQGDAAMYIDTLKIAAMSRDPKLSKVDGKVGFALHPVGVRCGSETGGFAWGSPPTARTRRRRSSSSSTSPPGPAIAGWWSSAETRCGMSTIAHFADRFPEYPVVLEQLPCADPDWRPLIPGVERAQHRCPRTGAHRGHHHRRPDPADHGRGGPRRPGRSWNGRATTPGRGIASSRRAPGAAGGGRGSRPPRPPVRHPPPMAASAAGRLPGRRRPRLDARALTPYWFILPAVLVMAAGLVYPVADALYLSFFDWKIATPFSKADHVGFANYVPHAGRSRRSRVALGDAALRLLDHRHRDGARGVPRAHAREADPGSERLPHHFHPAAHGLPRSWSASSGGTCSTRGSAGSTTTSACGSGSNRRSGSACRTSRSSPSSSPTSGSGPPSSSSSSSRACRRCPPRCWRPPASTAPTGGSRRSSSSCR